jgi:hypothetical protein
MSAMLISLLVALGCHSPSAQRDHAAQEDPPSRWEDLDCTDARVRATREGPIGYSSVMGAVEEAADGETLILCDGVHEESLIVSAQTLHITAAPSALVTLRAPLEERALHVEAGASLVIEGLAITATEGVMPPGDGGLISLVDADLQLIDVELQGGRTCGNGGAIAALATQPGTERLLRISGSTFYNGEAEGDGGLVSLVAEAEASLRLELSTTTLSTGVAGGAGGLLSVDGEGDLSAFIVDSALSFGEASRHGGAIAVLARPRTVYLELASSLVSDSTAQGSGGLLFINAAERSDTRSLLSTDTQYHFGKAGEDGGALRVAGFGRWTGHFEGGILEGNEAGQRGGALALFGPELAQVEQTGRVLLFSNRAGAADSAAVDFGAGLSVAQAFEIQAEKPNRPWVLVTPSGTWNSDLTTEVGVYCGDSGYQTVCSVRVP